MDITLRQAKPEECEMMYDIMHRDMTWKETDAPYFPYEQPTLEAFREGAFKSWCELPRRKVIDVDGQFIGTVVFYWEHEPSRWLEIGLAIYNPNYWGKGIATKVLMQWITHVFETQNVERVGLTTWSGNTGMMRVAEKLGMKKEAQLRKVRYHNGEYYDSVKYGVLREEWFDDKRKL